MIPYFADERAVLIRGEALDALRAMPDESVDAVVTDPPAGINFMGKSWDGDKGGRDLWIAWLAEIFREVLRVLKPGGHALVWALPKTTHWTVTALEDAGFETRERVAHFFGCLTDDVEVLTRNGWRRGVDVKVGDSVAQWDPASGQITQTEVQETFRAPWSGDLVRFKNADTDQALTPNHRVYHRSLLWKRWSDYRCKDAGEIGRASPIRLPLAGLHDGAGIGGEDYAALLGWVWTEGGFDPTPGTGVRIYQSSVNADKVAEIDALLDRLGAHRRYSYERSHVSRKTGPYKYQAVTWYFSGDELANKVRADLPGKHPTYNLLWRMTLAEKRAFLRSALLGDGSKSKPTKDGKHSGGAWTLEQKDARDREWFVTLLAMVGWRGHNYARKARDGGSVSVTQHADTTVSPERMRDSVEHYVGDVWCVRVPTGAFVARRNGKVFVTGNSGFPKSLNVSKAIDASLGAERVAGADYGQFATRCRWLAVGEQCQGHGEEGSQSGQTIHAAPTAAATPEARQWDGWGTALKPAVEDWWLVRKPLGGTVVACVLEHGTGAINIDACRIGTSDTLAIGAGALGYQGADGSNPGSQSALGRFPANLILSHDERCVDVGLRAESRDYGTDVETRYFETWACVPGCPVREVDAQSGMSVSKKAPRGKGLGYGSGATGEDTQGRGHNDTGGASRFFYCPKPPKKETERGCEHLPARTAGEATDREDGSAGLNSPRAGAGRTGGARNHHPTKKSVTLMRYLCRLITPPGGLVLDPFTGSGTTGVAAIAEGFSFVGVERDLDDKTGEPLGYCEIIKARLTQALIDHPKKETP